MSYEPRIHLLVGPTLVRCGFNNPPSTTKNPSDVTCRDCLKQTFAEDSHPANGLGKMLCYYCDRPIRDHPVGPRCPFPQTDNPRPPTSRSNAGPRFA